MNLYNVIHNCVYLPETFYKVMNKSMHTLLLESGYFNYNDKVTVELINKELQKHPDCVDQWLQYSEDKRTSNGWYIYKNEKGVYVVAYMGELSERSKLEFVNVVEACAHYMKLELEMIRHIKN